MVDQLESLKNVAAALIAEAKDSATAEKAAALLKTISETEKQEAETGKLNAEKQKLENDVAQSPKRRRSEERTQIATVLVPLLSTAILGGTLALQSIQTYYTELDKTREEQRQRVAAEDVRWQEALKGLSGSREISTTALYLKMFLNTDRYAPLARQTAFQLLAGTNDTLVFKDLFDTLYVPVTWDNFPQIVDLSRTIVARVNPIYDKKFNRGETLTPQEQKTYDAELEEIKLICNSVSPLLKATRPAGVKIDLRSVAWWDCDLSNSDLSGAILEVFTPTRVNFKGANLTGATFLQDDVWKYTAWWRAAKMSPDLLAFLRQKWPYDPQLDYADDTVSLQDYQDNIARLAK